MKRQIAAWATLAAALTLDGAAPHLPNWFWYLVAAQQGVPGMPQIHHLHFAYDLLQPFVQSLSPETISGFGRNVNQQHSDGTT